MEEEEEAMLLNSTTTEPSHAPPPSGDLDRLPPSAARGQPDEGGGSAGTALPEDILADVLRRLPPRGIAVSRCVCSGWRAAVDGRRLLRADLLPRSVRGLLIGYNDLDYPAFLSRPSAAGPAVDILAGVSPDPDPRWRSFASVLDHCNGLLLLSDPCGLLVSNPATRRRARLPPSPGSGALLSVARLVFDPADSPHYKVLMVPESRRIEELDMELQDQVREDKPRCKEWPPSTWILWSFSSLTGKWEERSFAREDEPAEEMASNEEFPLWEGSWAYWRGAIYAQCNTGASSVIRISMSNEKYRIIKVPTDIEMKECDSVYLGRSEKGVFCASMRDRYTFRVWVLDESCGQPEWVLKYHIDLELTVSRVHTYHDQGIEGTWLLQDFNNGEDYGQQISHHVNDDEDGNTSALMERKFEWDFDNDSFIGNECGSYSAGFVTCLGFHPYKPVVFLNVSLRKVAAYHLNTSKVQILGNVCPKYYGGYAGHAAHIISSFIYTPCLMAEFTENKFGAPAEE